MGMLMIRCPITGRPFFTGRFIETATFRTTPVFSVGPIVRTVKQRMSGSPKTHGSANPDVWNVKTRVSNKLNQGCVVAKRATQPIAESAGSGRA